MIAILLPVCRELSDEDRDLLRLRFVEQLSQAEVARRLGTNQMAISRRQRRILTRLARAIGDITGAPAAEPRAA